MALWITLGGLVWVACSVLAYGLMLAHFQKGWPSIARSGYYGDTAFARWMALAGPIGLFVALMMGGTRYGTMYRNPHKEV